MQNYIIKQYCLLVEFLGNALGPDYEIILRDLTLEGSPIVAISNSTRSQKNPMTDLSKKLLDNNNEFKQDYIYNINSKNSTGYTRGATLLIRDNNDLIVGMLGIQFSDRRFMENIENLLKIIHPLGFNHKYSIMESNKDNVSEIFIDNPNDLMNEILNKSLFDTNIDLDKPISYDDRLNLVINLKKNGIFKIKGSVQFIAIKLKVSVATVYRYLNALE